jgi:formate transporter
MNGSDTLEGSYAPARAIPPGLPVAGGVVGKAALATAEVKVGLGLGQAVVLGVLANGLVCLAVWMSYSGRTVADKVLVIVPSVAAFVAAGFEHSVANMYFIPVGLLIKGGAPDSFWSSVGRTATDYPDLTWSSCCLDNVWPVTAGNILGGTVLVGVLYWFVYLRNPQDRGGRSSSSLGSLA